MAISMENESKNLEATSSTSLLESGHELLHDYADYKGCPSKRSQSGGWRSAAFILGAGGLERFAFRGVECNLINYLTGHLGESMAVAAANVNIWTGLGSIMPVVGAFLADSALGLHRTNILTCIVYILGLCLTTIAVAMISSTIRGDAAAVPSTSIQILFFLSIYLIALTRGFQSSIQVFGADQFDRKHADENKANSSFFNWWLFGISINVILAYLIVPYIQENIGWGIGFGIPCLAMILGLFILLLGNRTYRFAVHAAHGNIGNPNHEQGATNASSSFLNHDSKKIRELKKVTKLLPIWCTTLTYTTAWAQTSTLFTKQANTVDRSIGQTFTIPSASIRTFIPLSIMCFTPIYDQVFVPIAKRLTGNPSGIVTLQRIQIGMSISTFNMVISALVEKKRLEIALENGLIDIPTATVPMSFGWVVPQNVLSSVAYVFTNVGMQQFFYDRVPVELRSIGLSLAYGAVGVGNLLSSFLIYGIDKATTEEGSWFCDNLNRAHLDYFYWVLAGLGFIGSAAFAFLAKPLSREIVVQQNP